MPGSSHSAENIKISVLEMINHYKKVDKSKIHAIVYDQGSSFVRLFSKIMDDPSKIDFKYFEFFLELRISFIYVV